MQKMVLSYSINDPYSFRVSNGDQGSMSLLGHRLATRVEPNTTFVLRYNPLQHSSNLLKTYTEEVILMG